MPKKRSDKATVELLNGVGIRNPYGIAKAADVAYVGYIAADNGRGGHGARWQVIWPGRKTDGPNGHWMDNGNKTFSLFGYGIGCTTHAEVKAAALADALAWCEERWGAPRGGWKKFRLLSDTWWPADILDATIADLLGES